MTDHHAPIGATSHAIPKGTGSLAGMNHAVTKASATIPKTVGHTGTANPAVSHKVTGHKVTGHNLNATNPAQWLREKLLGQKRAVEKSVQGPHPAAGAEVAVAVETVAVEKIHLGKTAKRKAKTPLNSLAHRSRSSLASLVSNKRRSRKNLPALARRRNQNGLPFSKNRLLAKKAS